MKWLNGYRMRLLVVGCVIAIVLGGGSAEADYVFGEPMNLGPTVNSLSDEAAPSIADDGLGLFFASKRLGGEGANDLWVTVRPTTSAPWEEPANLGPTINSSSNDAGPDISANGLTLFFHSDRTGGSGGADLWVSTRNRTDDDWGEPVNLGPTVNSSQWEFSPSLSADGLSLFFASNRSGGPGGSDLWVTTRATTQDDWGSPVNLGPTVNSSYRDLDGDISAEGLSLFFLSDRPGGYGDRDLWLTTRPTHDDEWDTPVNLGPRVNTPYDDRSPCISPDGSTLYFRSNRPDGVGGNDLWQTQIEPVVDFTGDYKVNIDDLVILIEYWGQDEPSVDIGPTPLGDGVVDVADLEVLMSYWGQTFDDPHFIAHWKLDETEGMFAYDSAEENDGIVFGKPVWQPESGQEDGALEFDGVDDLIMADFVINPAHGPFSVFAWIKGGEPGQVIMSQQAGVNWLQADADGTLMTELMESGGRAAGSPLYSESLITDGNWHRVGFVWDGSQRILYADDIPVAADDQSGLDSSTGGMIIGVGRGQGSQTSSFWSGMIDDVRIYDRVVEP